MRRSVPALLLVGCASVAEMDAAPPQAPVAGDPNGDGASDISDAVFLENYLFRGGAEPVCDMAADVLPEGVINLADAHGILGHAYAQETDIQPFDEQACGKADPSRARPARRVGIAWDAPRTAEGIAGAASPVTATVVLTTLDAPVQAWAFQVEAEGCELSALSTDGTDAAWVNADPPGKRASLSYDRHVVTDGVGVAAVVLDTQGDTVLDGEHPILNVTAVVTPKSGECAECTLTIPDRRAAGRVGTVATINGWSYPLEGQSTTIKVCGG